MSNHNPCRDVKCNVSTSTIHSCIQQRKSDRYFPDKRAIARQIVEKNHAGKLSANSILSQGREFLIEI
ncbi:hypothetical protein [Nostoc sp.]|uniref:hypothetical protein n=1 Tax=Nostoc sp. TaxID=1180 RepID=UPI002FF8DB64